MSNKANISSRGRGFVKELGILPHADFSVRHNMYNKDTNPEGNINLGTAESHLIDDELIEVFGKIQREIELKPAHFHYEYFHGSEEFRQAIADHWNKVIFPEDSKHKFTKDNVSVGTGCSLALERLAFMLGNDGDVILTAAPFYSGFIDDFTERAGVELIGVQCRETFDIESFEKAYDEQVAAGKRVCGILFANPNNPVGYVYSEETLKDIIDFAMEKDLDIISDEIYAETVHGPGAEFTSTMALVPDEFINRVHITSSFAKDFGLSGFRTGFILSFDEEMLMGVNNQAYFCAVSTHTQALLTELLKSDEVEDLIAANRDQLHQAHVTIIKGLKEMDVDVLEAEGGIFVMADFSNYMEEDTFEAEWDLWEVIFKELKVNISPGQVFGMDEPGWFRVCYADKIHVIEEALNRLKTLERKNN